MLQHVDLYVNDYSLNLCDSGKESVLKLREEYLNLNGIEDKFVYRFFV
jgi:hypothetical protein